MLHDLSIKVGNDNILHINDRNLPISDFEDRTLSENYSCLIISAGFTLDNLITW
jgi:hypothetical protein